MGYGLVCCMYLRLKSNETDVSSTYLEACVCVCECVSGCVCEGGCMKVTS